MGLKGEVKVKIITSFPEHLTALKELNIKTGNSWQAFPVERARINNRFAFIKFAGINLIEEAEWFRDKELFIPETELTALDKDSFYVHELIGLSVYNTSGKLIGKIMDVESYASNDVYIIKSVSGDKLQLPAVKSIIKEVDITAEKIVIEELEGLFD